VALTAAGIPGGPQELLRRLRSQPTPVIARVVDDKVALDPRTISPDEEPLLLQQVQQALGQ
jgi:seryl-tRNA(Sec) selenium transferase